MTRRSVRSTMETAEAMRHYYSSNNLGGSWVWEPKGGGDPKTKPTWVDGHPKHLAKLKIYENWCWSPKKESLDKAEFFSVQEGRLRNPLSARKRPNGPNSRQTWSLHKRSLQQDTPEKSSKTTNFPGKIAVQKMRIHGVEWSYMELQGGILRPWTRKTWRTYKTPHIMWREAQCRTQLCFFFTYAASSSAAD